MPKSINIIKKEPFNNENLKKDHKEIKKHLLQEWICAKDYLFYLLWKRKGIYNKQPILNKLIVLDKAREIGLNVPEFILSDYKIDICFDSITKAMGDAFTKVTSNSCETFYTEKIDALPYNDFYVSLIQKYIKPKYEIRTIVLGNRTWSMAIHNFCNNFDYRKSYECHRYSPYVLPQKTERKLLRLCKEFELKYGAVDFVVDKYNRHYFLEINPFGQFGMVSLPCNYNIEYEIAKTLKENDV